MNLLPTPKFVKFGEDRVVVGPESPCIIPPETSADVVEDLKAWLKAGAGSTGINLVLDPALASEAYRIQVLPEGVTLAASCNAGWRMGMARLRQLGPLGELRACELEDQPGLALRGFHINFTIQTMGFDDALQLLESMARWRLNTVLLEYYDRYPYAKHPLLSATNTLTREQVQELVAHARHLNLEIIPLHQCLGHVEHILRHEPYADLREEDAHRDQFCPLKPGALALFKELVDDFCRNHPGIRYFHIGGDETRRLGACSACAAEVLRHGKGGLYVDYVIRAAQYVMECGLTPIVWDDMLCAYPDVIEQMPRDVVIMYWDYWTTHDPSALFVARPARGFGVVADSIWFGERIKELSETEQRTVRRFARNTNLIKELPGSLKEKFAAYLGPEFPERIRAFPYLEYYQELGFKVIGASAGGSNTSMWHGLPDFPRYSENTRAFCRRLNSAGALGIITTAWYNVPPEAMVPGIMAAGQFAWNPAAE